MRRQFKSITYLALLTIVAGGCGSTGSGDGNDATILRFRGFDSKGITQADSVSGGNADVDVVQNLCQSSATSGGQVMVTDELFTQTVVNATFENDEKLDISLNRYDIHIADPNVGVGDVSYPMSGTILGGRCANALNRPCASELDCVVGTTRGNCQFSLTKLDSLLLVDLDTKDHVSPLVYGRGLPINISFFGSDIVGNQYVARANYTITFDNFCNCSTGELCIAR
ncbi:MAG: hypothetical protein HY270_03040 [Deltaproteobacteria bacterium]|nr:hypothetical protein [Deltaproteobacteria bacterium]